MNKIINNAVLSALALAAFAASNGWAAPAQKTATPNSLPGYNNDADEKKAVHDDTAAVNKDKTTVTGDQTKVNKAQDAVNYLKAHGGSTQEIADAQKDLDARTAQLTTDKSTLTSDKGKLTQAQTDLANLHKAAPEIDPATLAKLQQEALDKKTADAALTTTAKAEIDAANKAIKGDRTAIAGLNPKITQSNATLAQLKLDLGVDSQAYKDELANNTALKAAKTKAATDMQTQQANIGVAQMDATAANKDVAKDKAVSKDITNLQNNQAKIDKAKTIDLDADKSSIETATHVADAKAGALLTAKDNMNYDCSHGDTTACAADKITYKNAQTDYTQAQKDVKSAQSTYTKDKAAETALKAEEAKLYNQETGVNGDITKEGLAIPLAATRVIGPAGDSFTTGGGLPLVIGAAP